MLLYSMVMTMGLTWMILIQPNQYTVQSNAADWLLTMFLFVFIPMLIYSLDGYVKRVEGERKAVSRASHIKVSPRHTAVSPSRGIKAKSYSRQSAVRHNTHHTSRAA